MGTPSLAATPSANRRVRGGFLLKSIATLLIYLYYDYAMYFCDRGVELGLLGEEERDRPIEEIVAGTPKELPSERVYQAFWQARGWPNQ